MIVIKLSGGLGNQMLQYSLAVFLKQCAKDVKLDISSYQYINEHYGPELFSVFNIEVPAELGSSLDGYYKRERKLEYYTSLARKYRILPLLSPWKMRHLFRFKCERYEFPEIDLNKSALLLDDLLTMDDCILKGCAYPFYLHTIEEQIREKYTFPTTSQFREMVSMMENSESVAIHVRRGDYLSYQNLSLPDQYYHVACSIIEKKVPDAHFYVFSEDNEFVRYLFKDKTNVTFMNGNEGNNSYWDMYLMSKCKHNIIANSTFSWWGAWLNMNSNKITIRPNRWFDNYSFFSVTDNDLIIDY
ncbi:MAG: alpha-1,2-fucosyltransferase [Parabacteroides sp.]|nr:alpha-1,2-fucosyltransferase [Parabacteroides sp.]